MKFLCDRCKTRYSIGDDRVRGKILKIRCKNCNNVITVREGMTADEAPEPAGAPRRQKHTMEAPIPAASAPAANGGGTALGAAFASAMTKPPPALEEEWYVSIDGEQAGPYSLAEAQRWVSSKPFDADLHCWSEGFDDWLPVDKVSHFRGLRKPPAAAPRVGAPPPIPSVSGARATGGVRALAREEEPKPLFAATMASLEKSAPTITPTPSPLGGLGAAVPRANGTAPSAAVRTKPAFDTNELADSATQIEAPPFQDEASTAAEPVAAAARMLGPSVGKAEPAKPAGNDAFVKAMSNAASDAAATTPQMPKADPFARPAGAPFGGAPAANPFAGMNVPSAKAPIADEDIDGDGDLDIGEVSRVVKLTDLARSAPIPRVGVAAPVAQRQSGPIPTNQTGSVPRIPLRNATAPLPSLAGDPAAAMNPALVPGAEVPALAPAAVSHRRGMIALVAGAALLLGLAITVVVLVINQDDTTTSGLGRIDKIDTTRPDDPIRRAPDGTVIAENPQQPTKPTRPSWRPNPNPNPKTGNDTPTNPDLKALGAEEVEAMAAKYSGTTQRCYLRSQRGADAILVGDVKRIDVTLTVDKDGAVTDVKLSNHSQNALGKCLISSIRGWKFRPSSNGITSRITMVFQSG